MILSAVHLSNSRDAVVFFIASSVVFFCVQLAPSAGESGDHLHIAGADHSKQADGTTG